MSRLIDQLRQLRHDVAHEAHGMLRDGTRAVRSAVNRAVGAAYVHTMVPLVLLNTDMGAYKGFKLMYTSRRLTGHISYIGAVRQAIEEGKPGMLQQLMAIGGEKLGRIAEHDSYYGILSYRIDKQSHSRETYSQIIDVLKPHGLNLVTGAFGPYRHEFMIHRALEHENFALAEALVLTGDKAVLYNLEHCENLRDLAKAMPKVKAWRDQQLAKPPAAKP